MSAALLSASCGTMATLFLYVSVPRIRCHARAGHGHSLRRHHTQAIELRVLLPAIAGEASTDPKKPN